MHICNSSINDVGVILELYDCGIEYQKARLGSHWRSFDKNLLLKEIGENRHLKIIDQGAIACIFSVAFTDALLWGQRDSDPAIYLHRIVANHLFRGKRYTRHIIEWAKKYGKENNKKFIRLDTSSDNQQLNNYYTDCGFIFCGLKHFDKTENVPLHYLDADLSLFEIQID